MSAKTIAALSIVVILVLGVAGYVYYFSQPSTSPSTGVTTTTTSQQLILSGTIEIDGSSTVFPITEAVAEEFRGIHPDVRINVGISGTGGGFKRFVVGETAISDASRPITQSEKDAAAKNGIEYVELRVAIDGLAVIVNPSNNWVDYLTVQELKMIWHPNSTVHKWNDVRPSWPDRPITLYGPGTDSGTFDYFTEVVVGKARASRADYTASEDDNVLVQGIAGDTNALGYFGYAYYAENKNRLKIVPVDSGNGPITPSDETVRNGSYSPLSRPLFIYVNTKALQRPEVKGFVMFYLENAEQLAHEVGYTPLPSAIYQEQLTDLRTRFP